ncbi:hypothetical protein ACR79S_20285 [Sphingobacterium spiritivorum]|uniref:hypothetical protein n=1 Tax=Sphingobacterium spiritivorum TaxID=258 RepID=UPI003DA4989F
MRITSQINLVVENSKTGDKQSYQFADPEADSKAIADGTINKLVFVSKTQISRMLRQQGVFNAENKDNWANFYKESKGGGKYDYSYSVIPDEFNSQGAVNNPLSKPSPILFLAEGDNMVHNQMNFGNYLWAASGFTLGFNYSTLKIAAHGNSLFNSGSNGYSSQFDSQDDQRSIVKGAYFSDRNGYRKILDNIAKFRDLKKK